MTQKTLGYVELEWTCKRCGTKNPGTARTCITCGAPMGADENFEAPTDSKLITDPEKLAAAEKGPDFHCPYCGARNPAGTTECVQCGGDLKEASARQAGTVLGAFGAPPPPPIPCPACGAANAPDAPRCAECGAALQRPTPTAPAAPPPAAKAKSPVWMIPLAVGLGLLVCLCLIAFAVLSSRTTELTGRVSKIGWSRNVEVLALSPAEHQDWEDALPAEAEVEACEMRYRETLSEPAPQATEVCGTPYTLDQGSGVGKVVQDCEYQQYASYCTYTVPEWQVAESHVVEGQDFSPVWPDYSLTAGQKEGDRSETFTVTFAASNGQTYTYTPDSLEEYRQFSPNSEWRLTVNAFGSVTSVEQP